MIRKILRPLSSLKHKDFKYLFIGSSISWIGTQMQIVAIIWHLYKLTNSPYSLALIGLVRFIPLMLVSPLAGLTADRFNRKKIMFIAQLIAMFGSLILAVLTFTNVINPLLIYVLLAVDSTASALSNPAKQ